MTSILDKFKVPDLKEFVDTWAILTDGLDKEKAISLAQTAIKYYRGDSSARKLMQDFQDLEVRWYDSLKSGQPDYTVYDAPYILSDIWSCWVVYSRRLLLDARKRIVPKMKDVTGVVDLGNGIGYTTAALKEIYSRMPKCGGRITRVGSSGR